MPRKFSSTSAINSNASASDLDKRWDRILSFAGLLEDEEELTPEWLDEFRQAAWGNLDDGNEETPIQQSNS